MTRKFVFQAVHMLFGGQPREEWGPEERRTSRLVFIGKHLDRAELEASLRACMMDATNELSVLSGDPVAAAAAAPELFEDMGADDSEEEADQ